MVRDQPQARASQLIATSGKLPTSGRARARGGLSEPPRMSKGGRRVERSAYKQ